MTKFSRPNREYYRAWSYIAFGVVMAFFLAGFIPSLFAVNALGVLISLAVMLVALVVSVRMGMIGFAPPPKGPAIRTPHPHPQAPLDPRVTPFDDENWLRTHGGTGYPQESDRRRE